MPTDKATVEAALLTAAKEHDVYHVRETGNNRGPRVEMYLASVGLGPGNPWCAAFCNWNLKQAGYPTGPKVGAGAVRNWIKWADDHGRLYRGGQWARRGMLFCWLNSNQTGHIGFVAEVKKGVAGTWWIRTIEGNSDENGSREGVAVVRKWRLVTSKYRFIDLVNA